MWLARLRRRRAENPHLCQICGGDFVYPVDWQEATDTHLWVRMRCGECDSWREDTFTDEALDEFDQKLDVACGQIAEEADRLHREWRTKEADAFAAALDRGLIDAGDFAS